MFELIKKDVGGQKNWWKPWKYNIRKNVKSDIPIVTMCRVAIMFFELGVLKKFMQKF